MMKPMTAVYKSGMSDALISYSSAQKKLYTSVLQPETLKGISSLAKTLSATKAISNNTSFTNALTHSSALQQSLLKNSSILDAVSEESEDANVEGLVESEKE